MAPHPSTPTATRFEWGLFGLLSFMWGSSYLFIKIGVDEGLQPLTLIMLRLLFGALLLIGVDLVARPALPEHRRTYGHLVMMSLLSIVIPFWLITYGEGSGVDSSVAAILNSTVPLFTIVIAPLFLHDEHITANRLAGLAVGFVGVIVLTSGDLGGTTSGGGISFGIVALLLSAVSYALGAVYARRNARGLSPITTALFQVIYRDVLKRPGDRNALTSALDVIDAYLLEHHEAHLKPLLGWLRKQDRVVPLSEISDHFAFSQLHPWHLESACEWLEQKGLLQKLSAPFKLTKRSQGQVEEPAYSLRG